MPEGDIAFIVKQFYEREDAMILFLS